MKKIRFINSKYNTLFTINDGDTIIVEYSDGEKNERVCSFIDEYHTRIGTVVYHICQFAEICERNGTKVYPKTFAEKEITFANSNEFLNIVLDDTDLFNFRTGEYVFHYNNDNAIAVYKLSYDEAVKCAKKSAGEEYWGAFLGPGGTIFDNPTVYVNDEFTLAGWITCEDFAEFCANE